MHELNDLFQENVIVVQIALAFALAPKYKYTTPFFHTANKNSTTSLTCCITANIQGIYPFIVLLVKTEHK